MNIKLLADRVLILPAPAEEKTIGGIIIPDTAKEKPLDFRLRQSSERFQFFVDAKSSLEVYASLVTEDTCLHIGQVICLALRAGSGG